MYENEFGAFVEISEFLSSNLDENERLAEIAKMLERRLDMRRVTLLLMAADEDALVVEGSDMELDGGLKFSTNNKEYKRGEGIIGRVLETQKAVIVPRISDEPNFQSRIYDRKNEDTTRYGFICVPIIAGGKTVGALAADIPLVITGCSPAEHGCKSMISGEKKSTCLYGKDNCRLQDIRYFMTVIAGIIAHDVQIRRKSNLRNRALLKENLRLHSLYGDIQTNNIIGTSDAMRDVFAKISQIAPADTTALIRGESGTGKELVASAIHYSSSRQKMPFIKVNCAALSESLLESELFGHEKGAFTGAVQSRVGRVTEAEGGTLFLDEIGDFSPTIQVKLLRLLQEREYSIVGTNDVRKANVRFICATNSDLEVAVEEGTFRQDLYYRINVFPIYLPPLRNRRSDILPLANHFVEKYGKQMHKTIRRISSSAIDLLVNYYWPGNVRELENCIQHGVLVCSGDALQGSDLPPSLMMPDKNARSNETNLKKRIDILELDMITDALKRTKGNVAAAARELGITARMVRYKIQKFRIDLDRLVGEPR